MTRTRKVLVVLCLWACNTAFAAGAPPPYCFAICSSSTSCNYACVHGEEWMTCGDYGICGDDPCQNPSPVWQPIADDIVGAFQQEYFDGQFYCDHYATRRVIEQDVQACVSARQPNRAYCYYVHNGRLYEPYHYYCCGYWWCGGSGASCPGL